MAQSACAARGIRPQEIWVDTPSVCRVARRARPVLLLTVGMSIPREHSPDHPRLGGTLILSAGVALFGCWFTGLYAFTGSAWVGAGIAIVALVAAVVGVALLFSRRPRAAGVQVAERMLGRGPRVVLGAVASAVLLVVVALGFLDGYVWMPEALMPGMTAAEIRVRMGHAGELDGALVMLRIWAVCWGLAALAPLVLGLIGPAWLTARRMLLVTLGIVAAAIFFQWMGTFAMGMGVADTFGTSGGQSPFWVFYSLLGQASLIAAIALWLRPWTGGPGVP